jgi:hypothetical protein
MTIFNRREEAFETEFAHGQERAFEMRERALHMLGLWAAEKRGETGAAAEAYARGLIETDVGAAPDAAFSKLVADLAGYGVDAEKIREKRDALLAIAQQNPA